MTILTLAIAYYLVVTVVGTIWIAREDGSITVGELLLSMLLGWAVFAWAFVAWILVDRDGALLRKTLWRAK